MSFLETKRRLEILEDDKRLGIDYIIYDTTDKRRHRRAYLKQKPLTSSRKELHKRMLSYRRRVKAKLIERYGGKCVCCGDDHFEFLTFDHVNNDGAADRRKNGTDVYRKLINKPIDSNFQLLCMNCNFAKGKYGECPHERERAEKYLRTA